MRTVSFREGICVSKSFPFHITSLRREAVWRPTLQILWRLRGFSSWASVGGLLVGPYGCWPQKKLGKCHDFGHQTLSLHISRWWFQIFLLFFIPICGRLPFWLIFFDWVVQQPPIYDILLIIDYIVWLWVGLFSNKPKFRVRAAMFVCCFVEVMFQDQLFHGEMMWKQKDKIWSRDADGSSFYC